MAKSLLPYTGQYTLIIYWGPEQDIDQGSDLYSKSESTYSTGSSIYLKCIFGYMEEYRDS